MASINGATLGISQQMLVAGNSLVIGTGGTLLLEGGEVLSDTQNFGQIAGNGTIVGNVNNDGEILPSAAQGKLSIAGNYTQSTAGTLSIEVLNAGQYGQLAVTGNADLAGLLNVFSWSGYKFNYGQIFSDLVPSFYQSVSSIGLTLVTTEAELVDQKIGAQRLDSKGSAGPQSGNFTADASGKSLVETSSAPLGSWPADAMEVWFQSAGLFGDRYSVANLPNYRYSSGAFLIGADYRWNEHLKMGLFAGYQAVDARYPESGRLRVNGINFGGYAAFDAGNGLYANLIGRGGYGSYTANRPIEFGSLDRVARSDFNSGDGGMFLESGYDIKVSQITVGPVVNAQYTYFGVGSFTESNAGSLDLRMDRRNVNSFQTNLGGRIAYTWKPEAGTRIIPECRIFWNHEYLQGATGMGASLGGGAGPHFNSITTPPSRDSVFAAIGINGQFGKNWNVAIYYNVDFGSPTSLTSIISADIGFAF